MAPGEVLLSVLGSAPKVVLNHPPEDAKVWLADHWARFRRQPHPGALALLLGSPPVVRQLMLAASGAARQFVARTELAGVRVPWPEPAMARRWHDGLTGALEAAAEATERLTAIRTEVAGLVDGCLGRSR